MAAYTRNPQAIPDDSPGGSTVRQGVKDQNSQAIDDLYVDLNAHSNNESGLSHAQIDTKFTEIDDPVTGIVPKAEAARDAVEASATAAATSEANAATSEANSATSETNAAASEIKAQEWATNPEDAPVETALNKFSALHWAAKSEGYADQSRLYGEKLLDIKQSIKNTPNEGWGWAWGGTFLRADYPDAWAKIQTESRFITEAAWQSKDAAQGGVGSIAFFSDGDGSTTFRVPRLVDFHRGSTSATASDSVLDSAPNIEGVIQQTAYADTAGAFHKGEYITDVVTGSKFETGYRIEFDASLSDSTYGRSNEVAPKHWLSPWQIKLK